MTPGVLLDCVKAERKICAHNFLLSGTSYDISTIIIFDTYFGNILQNKETLSLSIFVIYCSEFVFVF